jgi:hypothetical protein
MIAQAAQPGGNDWTRKYPPLLAVVAAIGLAIFALPSALNLPQANPGQVAEYAPVPGSNGSAPPGGNFAGLGLGEGGAAQGAAELPGSQQQPGQPPPPPPPGGTLPPQLPSGFECVGNPPRQTPDPLAPPCVPYFHGDNGGSTWIGVTGKEVAVVFRFFEFPGECRSGVAESNNCGAPTGYYDMDNPSDVNQEFLFRYVHDWEIYFNAHYQTYGRHVHFWAYNYGNTAHVPMYSATDAETDAADNWNHTYGTITHPFAALDQSFTFTDAYSQYLAQKKVLEFQLSSQFTDQDFHGWPGYFWSYPPPLDRVAEAYATYVCTRIVAPGKVSFAGSSFAPGSPRAYGLLTTTDTQWPDIVNLNKLAAADMQRDCGLGSTIPWAAQATYKYTEADATGPSSGWGVPNMTRFIKAGVTTVIWPGGNEYEDQRDASQLHYYPEWVLAGDGQNDGNLAGIGWPPDESSHFVVVTSQTRQNADGHGVEQPCSDALRQVDPTVDRQTLDYSWACGFFAPIRQFFTGIQLSGPRLNPTNINQGFHAIPDKPSTGPDEPACFYLSNDYSCIKDDVAEFFDPNAQTTSSNPTADQSANKGCWRMWQNGFRYLPGEWPSGDARQGYVGNEVCNLVAGGYINIQRTDMQ